MDFVEEAWTELQMARRDWTFRFGEFTEPVAAGVGTETLASIGAQTILQPTALLLVKDSDTTQRRRLILLDREFFDRSFVTRSTTQTGFPLYACYVPPAAGDGDDARHRVRFEVLTDEPYTLSGTYQTAVQTLAANGDIPLMPEQYHMAIFYLALMKWAEFEESDSVYITAKRHYDDLFTVMCNDLLPKILVGQDALDSGGGRVMTGHTGIF